MASTYVLHPLDPFFVLIYEGSNKIRVRRNKRKGVQVTNLNEIEIDNDLSN